MNVLKSVKRVPSARAVNGMVSAAADGGNEETNAGTMKWLLKNRLCSVSMRAILIPLEE